MFPKRAHVYLLKFNEIEMKELHSIFCAIPKIIEIRYENISKYTTSSI